MSGRASCGVMLWLLSVIPIGYVVILVFDQFHKSGPAGQGDWVYGVMILVILVLWFGGGILAMNLFDKFDK